jgi:hypothetical protein
MNAPVKPVPFTTAPSVPLGFGVGGPGPQPDPWLIQGASINYSGGVVVGAPIGQAQGAGTLNAQDVFVNGTDVQQMIQTVSNHFGAIDCGTF